MKCATYIAHVSTNLSGAHGALLPLLIRLIHNYLHEVCHSCTNLVHGVVPEVYTYMKCATRVLTHIHGPGLINQLCPHRYPS